MQFQLLFFVLHLKPLKTESNLIINKTFHFTQITYSPNNQVKYNLEYYLSHGMNYNSQNNQNNQKNLYELTILIQTHKTLFWRL